MMIFMTLKAALKSLRANKLRSFLAMLGIIIGVGAVVSMLAMGAGAQQQVLKSISGMGSNLLIVRPSQSGMGGVKTGVMQNMTVEDAEALLTLPGVSVISPVVRGSAQIKCMNHNTRVDVYGAANTYLSMRGFEIGLGRNFSDSETHRLARVVVLGPVTATNLFGTDDPLDKMVKINGINFQVIGIIKEKGDNDDQAVMPYTVAMRIVFGVPRLREIDVQGINDTVLAPLTASITETLRRRHHISGDEEDDFTIRNMADIQQAITNTTRTFSILLGSIAGISLVVGGIGIMNIMLVTVTERTREIGVRKAIGARNRDILRQFLIEAVLVSMVGGTVGVLSGVGVALLLKVAFSFPIIVEAFSIILSLSCAAAIGIFFGWYPAYRAACLDPIEALRYE